MTKAAVSVMSNIAEGFGRRSDVEFERFLDISRDSLREVQSLLYVGLDLHYFTGDQFDAMYREATTTASLTTPLITSIRRTRKS